MTTDREDILNAIADEPLTCAEIVEATGLDPKLVSNRLFVMKRDGLVTVENHRYSPAESAPKPQNIPQIIPARETKASPAETKPPKRATKARKAKPALPPPATSVPNANGRVCEFAIAESGAVLFKITAGPRAGELGEIGCADALALYRLMSAVEFISENA